MTETNTNNSEDNSEIFSENDFTFTQTTDDNGVKTIIGGGYKINSLFLQGGTSIMKTINTELTSQNGGKVSSPFENLAVPAGLFYVNMRVPKNNIERESTEHYKRHETISDDMIDKLYSLVEVDKKRKRKTRKVNKKHQLKKTRRLKSRP